MCEGQGALGSHILVWSCGSAFLGVMEPADLSSSRLGTALIPDEVCTRLLVGKGADDASMCCACSGARYSLYCANLARTYLVDPSKQQQEQYAALLAAADAASKALAPGAKCSAAYAAAVQELEVGMLARAILRA